MKSHLPTVLMLIIGLVVMAGLLYLGALSQNWVAPLCFIAVAVVFYTWLVQLVLLVRPKWGQGDKDDDRPIFPG
jgi:uncharacterized membrane protein